ncbi:hypothetical protein [Sphingomonas sanxanigenens]|uniref:Lipoprotein n=1 Tax=Sphingomonas sanxanigenens DSM 19645 = NX02 TaxID=1123269 RepID=W0AME7_9SPHN|nr:hypothetical protein [Sphingomonas sanxanigenens]AHE56890.1 hypothetical protein NX02_26480 [Sphingomonas sanxanigenens DSM 19645 = NX02]
MNGNGFRTLPLAVLGIAALLLSGCLARTAVNVVTLPVKAGSKAVDWTTTSRDEADRNRGRKMRKQEEREAKERKRAEREARKARERDEDY